MMIEQDEAVATGEHEDKNYYFCSEDCREGFEEDPGAYGEG